LSREGRSYSLAPIKIQIHSVRNLSTSLSKDVSRLADLENEISSLNHQLDWRIKERGNLHQRIDRSSRSIKELEARVRALENMIQCSMNRYEQAEDSLIREANRIGQIKTIKTGEGNATNPFFKSLNSFKEIGQDIWSEMTNRNEKKFDSWYDFGNYMTLGIFDSVQAFYEGMQHRWRVATNSSYDFINYLSMGGFATVKGTFNPEEAYSKEHWLNSMGVFGYFVGMGTLMKGWNSTRLGMNKEKAGQTVDDKGAIDTKGTVKFVSNAENVVFKQSSLDKAFTKHKNDFGSYPDGSKSSVELFKNDISELINTGVQKQGKYRNVEGTHIYNEATKQWTFINSDGTLNTAFKLSDIQLKYLIETGVVK